MKIKYTSAGIGSNVPKPYVSLVMCGQNRRIAVDGMIDSGSDHNLFSIGLAQICGIDLTHATQVMVAGFNHSGKKNEAVKQLEFLKKLFEGNPECLELHELVTQAEEAIKLSQYDKALSLADAAVQSCKDLVSSKGKELKLPKQIRINDIVILIVELISFSFISYGRRLKFS